MHGRVVSPVSDAPYNVVKASFRETPIASVQGIIPRLWALGELGVVGTDDHIVSLLEFPHGDDIKILDFSSVLLV